MISLENLDAQKFHNSQFCAHSVSKSWLRLFSGLNILPFAKLVASRENYSETQIMFEPTSVNGHQPKSNQDDCLDTRRKRTNEQKLWESYVKLWIGCIRRNPFIPTTAENRDLPRQESGSSVEL